MATANPTTPLINRVISSIGYIYSFNHNYSTIHNIDGQDFEYVHWKKGDFCTIRGVVVDSKDEGLCVEFDTDRGELAQIKISEFDQKLTRTNQDSILLDDDVASDLLLYAEMKGLNFNDVVSGILKS